MRALLVLFCSVLAALATPASAEADKRIALTFDDAPTHPGAFLTEEERTAMLIDALDRAGVEQVAFFATTVNLETVPGGAERLARLVAAGHVLANHTYSHPGLSGMTAEAFLADVDRAADWLHQQPGYRPWMRFPYLDEGGTDREKREAVRAGLAARGLSNGVVTAGGNDWQFDNLTVEAKAAGKTMDMAALRELWIDTHVGSAEFNDELARRTLGRSPAHVMLLHDRDVTALFVADLVAALKAKGWTIITADEAFADPLAAMLPDVPSAHGQVTEMVAWERGIPEPRWYAGNDQAYVAAEFERRVLQTKDQE